MVEMVNATASIKGGDTVKNDCQCVMKVARADMDDLEEFADTIKEKV